MDANPNMDIKRKGEKSMKKTLAILLAAVMLLAMGRSRDGGDPDRKHYGYRN